VSIWNAVVLVFFLSIGIEPFRNCQGQRIWTWERECSGGMMRKVVISLGMACGDCVRCYLRETQGMCAC